MRGFDIWRLRVIYECIILYYCTDCTENNVHIWEVLIITLNKALIFDLPLLTYIRKGLPASSFASSLPLSTTPASSNPNTIAAKKDLSLAHSGATQLQKCEKCEIIFEYLWLLTTSTLQEMRPQWLVILFLTCCAWSSWLLKAQATNASSWKLRPKNSATENCQG